VVKDSLKESSTPFLGYGVQCDNLSTLLPRVVREHTIVHAAG